MRDSYETLIGPAELAPRLGDPAWRLFDCRFDLGDSGAGERAHAASHLPGALYAHLDRDLSAPVTPSSGRHPLPDPDALCAWLGRLGVGSGTQVIAYDDSGGSMAVRLWWLLRWLGHRRVAVLDGGWQAWQRAGLPLEQAPPAAPAAVRFTGRPDHTRVVSSTAIAQQLQSGADAMLIVDARAGERFRGESEPIDPVAGHIPGAVNLPLGGNLDADGNFRPAAELRRRYRTVLGDRAPDALVAMCGSGVTACHNLLAMAVAGLDGGRLYAGSWSEWIRDPSRPVARGD